MNSTGDCRWRLFLSIVVAAVLLGTRTASAEVELQDIIKTLQDSEQELRAVTVTMQIDILHAFFPSGPPREVKLTSTERLTVDASGRARVEVDGQSFRDGEQVEIYPHKSLGVFDGQSARVMFGSKGYSHGLITSTRADIQMRMDPQHLLMHYFNHPISELLTSRGAAVVGEEDWEGRKVLLIETTPILNVDQRRYRFLIDPSLNFAVVKRAIAIQFAGHERWMEYTRITGSDYVERHPGLWVPQKAVHESLDPTPKNAVDGSDPPLSWRWNIELTNWEINPDLPDSIFKLEFGPGIYVNDKISGQNYQTAGISDELLKSQTDLAEQFRASETAPLRPIWSRPFMIVNGIILVIFLVALSARFLRRHA